jgi:hypothetical protein
MTHGEAPKFGWQSLAELNLLVARILRVSSNILFKTRAILDLTQNY